MNRVYGTYQILYCQIYSTGKQIVPEFVERKVADLTGSHNIKHLMVL